MISFDDDEVELFHCISSSSTNSNICTVSSVMRVGGDIWWVCMYARALKQEIEKWSGRKHHRPRAGAFKMRHSIQCIKHTIYIPTSAKQNRFSSRFYSTTSKCQFRHVRCVMCCAFFPLYDNWKLHAEYSGCQQWMDQRWFKYFHQKCTANITAPSRFGCFCSTSAIAPLWPLLLMLNNIDLFV